LSAGGRVHRGRACRGKCLETGKKIFMCGRDENNVDKSHANVVKNVDK